jgi:hypothetical protein
MMEEIFAGGNDANETKSFLVDGDRTWLDL